MYRFDVGMNVSKYVSIKQACMHQCIYVRSPNSVVSTHNRAPTFNVFTDWLVERFRGMRLQPVFLMPSC